MFTLCDTGSESLEDKVNETPESAESVDTKPIVVLRTRFGSDWRVTGNLVGLDVHIHSMSTQGIFSIVFEHER